MLTIHVNGALIIPSNREKKDVLDRAESCVSCATSSSDPFDVDDVEHALSPRNGRLTTSHWLIPKVVPICFVEPILGQAAIVNSSIDLPNLLCISFGVNWMSCFDTFLGPVASIRSNLSFARSICNFGASAMIATLVRSDPLVCGRVILWRLGLYEEYWWLNIFRSLVRYSVLPLSLSF